MNVNLEVGDRTWTWRNGTLELEATDPSIASGVVRAVVTVREEGAIVERSRLNLTSERERARFRGLLEGKGRDLDDGPLLAVEEAIRDADPGSGGGGEEGLQGQRLALADPEPWPDPVDGAALLEAFVDTFGRFLGLPEAAPEALALWALHAHAHDAAEVSPILAATSPEKRCGKTTALYLLGALVPRPLPASNVTAAALFRAVERYRPTLLVDEADTFLRDREELRGILNAGHHRAGAVVVRTVGDEYEARAFSTWAPKVIALIGDLPDTLQDRAIVLRMRRRAPGESMERLRLDRLGLLEPLRRQAARWAADSLDRLRGADPGMPDGLHDRAADNWRPLLAIADLAGDGWPERARRAAKVLSGLEEEDGGGSIRTLLLRDLRDLFHERGVDRLPSAELADALSELEDRPWPEWGRRDPKPITPTSIARLLRPFGVRPKVIKMPDGSTARGYLRHAFADAWTRYLSPDRGSEPSPPKPSSNDAAIRASGTCNRADEVTDGGSAENPRGSGEVTGVAPREGGAGGREVAF